MIKEYCFTKEWFENFKNKEKYAKIDNLILEKMIYAFHLLESLSFHKLDFVFKGGTSLLLLLKESRRFSIDIDIFCNEKRENLEAVFNDLIQDSKFQEWELDEHRSYKDGIPKAHYKFFYDSENRGGGSIILDILTDKPIYPEIVQVSIDNKWIEMEKEVLVDIPTIDCICGDKLTAFAPNTIGIPYVKSGYLSAMGICKQLFDLSMLFEEIEDFDLVCRTYHIFAEKEISYRQKELKISDTLSDTIETCLTIAKRGSGSSEEKANFQKLQKGINAFRSFLMTGVFRLENAIAAASRVAYMATKILYDDLYPLEKYDHQDISAILIKDPEWNFINKLKRLQDKSAYFYFYQVYRIMSDGEKS